MDIAMKGAGGILDEYPGDGVGRAACNAAGAIGATEAGCVPPVPELGETHGRSVRQSRGAAMRGSWETSSGRDRGLGTEVACTSVVTGEGFVMGKVGYEWAVGRVGGKMGVGTGLGTMEGA